MIRIHDGVRQLKATAHCPGMLTVWVPVTSEIPIVRVAIHDGAAAAIELHSSLSRYLSNSLELL
jgi:hypothetical protein